MIILHNGAPITDVTPGGQPIYVPGFEMVPAARSDAVQGMPGRMLQIQHDGVDIGNDRPTVIDVVADPERLLVTRGVGEKSHVVTLRTGVPIPAEDNLDDIPMIIRYEAWRDAFSEDFPDGYTNGETVDRAHDFSGNENDSYTGGSSDDKPTYVTDVINGKAVYRFNGLGQGLGTPNITSMTGADAANRWYYVVYCYRSIPGDYRIAWNGFYSDSANKGDYSYVSSGTRSLQFGQKGATVDIQSGTMPDAGEFILESMVSDSVTIDRKFGNGLGSHSMAYFGPVPNAVTTYQFGMAMEHDGSPSQFAPVDFAVAFVGNHALTSTQRSRIEAYVLREFGVSA